MTGDQIVMAAVVATEEVEEEEASEQVSVEETNQSAEMADAETRADKAASAEEIDHRLRAMTREDVVHLVTEMVATPKVAEEETMTKEAEVADLVMAAEEPTSTARDQELVDREAAEEAVPADLVPDQEVSEVVVPELEPLSLSEGLGSVDR